MVKRFTFLVCFVGLFVWPILVRTAAPSQQASQVTPTSVPQDRSAVGYLDLHKRHPNAAEGVEEFNTGYSVDEALRSLAQMRTFLVSFRELTELAQGKLSPAELAKPAAPVQKPRQSGSATYP